MSRRSEQRRDAVFAVYQHDLTSRELADVLDAKATPFTRSLAYAHGADGIRANAVAPGWVRTPMSEEEMRAAAAEKGSTPRKEFEALATRIALGRIAEPEEIAACCLFLASDEASFVTGAVLVADGGGRAPVQNRAV